MDYNIIIKPEKFDFFTVVPSYIFRHKKISIGATGIYCWLFSHKSKQKITVEFMCQHFKENHSAIRNKLNELIDNGYLVRKRIYDKGKVIGINYHLNDKPLKVKNLNEENLNEEKQAQSNINNNNNISNINNVFGSSIEYSNKLLDAYNHFLRLFPSKYQPKNDMQKNKWLSCLDKLVRIDKYTLEDIYIISKYIRNNDFWGTHFLSLLKLRNKDKNGIKYIDKYNEVYLKDNKPIGYAKVENLKDFYLYTNVNGHEKLGAELKSGSLLNEFNLSQILNQSELMDVIKFLRR